MVSVAPTLVDSAKLVTFWEVDLIFITLPDAIALTPITCRLVSAVIAAARFEAIAGSYTIIQLTINQILDGVI